MIVDSNICCEILLESFPETYYYTFKGEDIIFLLDSFTSVLKIFMTFMNEWECT